MRESGRTGTALKEIGISPEVLMVSFSHYEHSMWIEQNGRRLGGTHLRMIPSSSRPGETEEGFILYNQTRVNLQMIWAEMPINIRFEAKMNPALELDALQAQLEISGRKIDFQAFIEDHVFYYRIKSEGALPDFRGLKTEADDPNRVQAKPDPVTIGEGTVFAQGDRCGSFTLDKPILMKQSILPVLSNIEELQVGDNWITESADPLVGALNYPVQIRVEAWDTVRIEDQDVDALRISEKMGQIESLAWYDIKGQLLRREIKGGLVSGVHMTCTDLRSLILEDEGFRSIYMTPSIDREYIQTHQDPQLENRPLDRMLPGITGF